VKAGYRAAKSIVINAMAITPATSLISENINLQGLPKNWLKAGNAIAAARSDTPTAMPITSPDSTRN